MTILLCVSPVLKQLGAPPRLIPHVCLVAETAYLLIQKFNRMNVLLKVAIASPSDLFPSNMKHLRKLAGIKEP